jgi:hypothetical protein
MFDVTFPDIEIPRFPEISRFQVPRREGEKETEREEGRKEWGKTKVKWRGGDRDVGLMGRRRPRRRIDKSEVSKSGLRQRTGVRGRLGLRK